ncbi:hypothetical protein W023_03975, partial [Mycobacterium tuberculosis TB_RSA113]
MSFVLVSPETGAYAFAEAANASPLQSAMGAVSASAQTL